MHASRYLATSMETVESVSLLGVGFRNPSKLLKCVKQVRVTLFHSPSSFYVQLLEEDSLYESLESDLLSYYGDPLGYCFNDSTNKPPARFFSEKKLNPNDLKSSVNICLNHRGRWFRCITQPNPYRCKAIDTGETIILSPEDENKVIFETEACFLRLPPRAILCGLANILPVSPLGPRWTNQACHIFRHLIRDASIRALFDDEGLYPNTFYLFLRCCIGSENVVVHVNAILIAFECAVSDIVGIHHPIWPQDHPPCG